MLQKQLIAKRVLIIDPTFWEYEEFFSRFGKKINKIKFKIGAEIDWNEFENRIKKNDVVIICNPNNPDNRYMDKNNLIKLIKKYPKKEFIIDETYLFFSEGFEKETLIDSLRKKNKNVSVLVSLSKLFGIGGVRCGILFSSSEKIRDVEKQKGIYQTPTLNQKIVQILLRSKFEVRKKREQIIKERNLFLKRLSKIKRLEIISGKTNFFLILADKNLDLEKMLRKKGIIVKRGDEFGFGKNVIRVSTQTRKENNFLLKTLREII